MAALRSLVPIGRRLVQSARAWVLFVLSVIAALVIYYVLSDRHTPFTTDAYVQAYVIQVAARVEGQVVRVHVQENQAVAKGETLFEIDPRPFEYRVALLEAKQVDATQQVAQLESESSAARPRADRQGRAGAGGADRGRACAGGRGPGAARRGPAQPRVDAYLRPRQRVRHQRSTQGGVLRARGHAGPHLHRPGCVVGRRQLPGEQPRKPPARATRRPHLQHLSRAHLCRGGGERRLGGG